MNKKIQSGNYLKKTWGGGDWLNEAGFLYFFLVNTFLMDIKTKYYVPIVVSVFGIFI